MAKLLIILVGIAVSAMPALAQTAAPRFSGQLAGQSCVPQVSLVQMDSILAENNIKVGNIANDKRAAIASAVQRISKVAGNKALFNNVTVNIHDGGRDGKCTSYTSSANSIELVTNCTGGKETAFGMSTHYMHEMGHILGLRGYYASYQRNVPACGITHYCTHNTNKNPRNEEFAEVFATYMHAPNQLKAQCPQAFDFMRRTVFPTGANPEDCSGNNKWQESQEVMDDGHAEKQSTVNGGLSATGQGMNFLDILNAFQPEEDIDDDEDEEDKKKPKKREDYYDYQQGPNLEEVPVIYDGQQTPSDK